MWPSEREGGGEEERMADAWDIITRERDSGKREGRGGSNLEHEKG